MVAGADSIDDMAILRHGGMRRVFDACYAPSTLGSFLRTFRFGHVRQLDAVASRTVIGLAQQVPLLPGVDEYALVDVDDSIIEVHGYAKQGAGFGYTKVRGLNSFIGTVSTAQAAPVIVAQRLRKGSCGSARGAARLVVDAARRAKADVSITVRQTKHIKAVISTIGDDASTTIKYPKAVFDEPTGRWISRAEVAEIPFVAFASRRKSEQVPGRLVVRRIPDLNLKAVAGQPTLFDTWRFHAFFTTSTLDTVTADKTHRGHAIIEQVHADLKNSASAHLPSKSFAANAAARAGRHRVQPDQGRGR